MADNITLLAAASIIITIKKRRKQQHERRRGRLWCQQWLIKRRTEGGMKHFVLNEFVLSDTGGSHSFLRMSPSTYDELLRMIEPRITKNDTFMRDRITTHEKRAQQLFRTG